MQNRAADLASVDVGSAQRTGTISGIVPLFSLTVFTGSALLFLIQPMFAKIALPRLGGSPSVWNTCVLFFQTALLLGYLYAHVSTRRLGVRRQIMLHLIVLLLPLLALPITLGDAQPPTTSSPVWWLLRTMAVTVGLPFFVLSTSAPLLQRWFASLPMTAARDPYFLYSASNMGSMLALIAYPLLLEPSSGTRQQTWLWAIGYGLFVVLTGSCGVLVRNCVADRHEYPEPVRVSHARPSGLLRIKWLVLSFVPSSLLLGVTTHISTDIAAVPLLWILPLAMYLGTFVLAFAKREFISHRWLTRLLPPLIFGCLLTILFNGRAWWFIPLHLTTFFVAAMVCHRQLASYRPTVEHLTEFYIWMSIGGTLGGVLNTLIAPQVFSTILEYPLVLACAAIARPSPHYRGSRPESLLLVAGLPAFVLIVCVSLWAAGFTATGVGLRPLLLGFGIVLAMSSMALNRVSVFGIAALAFVATIAFGRPSGTGTILRAARSFFGVHRVIDAPDGRFHLLQHGSTTHGRQEWPAKTTCEPTGYYHRSNPIGELFRASETRFKRVAVVGLGSGSLACYAGPGDVWTFYEIDPVVDAIARDPRYFTHLQNTRGTVSVVLGDGRLMLQRADTGAYNLIILDAFSSDAIPVHLLTTEAMAIYLSKLQPTGVLAVHISNRYINLEPLLAGIAALDNLSAVAKIDTDIPPEDERKGRFPSHWVLLARTEGPLATIAARQGWRPPTVNERVRPWTDDYSNIIQVLGRH